LAAEAQLAAVRRLLGSDYFIAFAASMNDEIVAGIAAYTRFRSGLR